MPLTLSDVTLCAADSVNMALTSRALERSVAQCTFGDAIFFTDAAVSGPFRTVKIEALRSKDAYNTFVLKTLPQHIKTPFVLIAQWDGYVLDAGAWKPEFLQYDYIGARWPWHQDGMTVGNGGFCLRSEKLLQACLDPEFGFISGAPEDNLICRTNRAFLEAKHGVRFAPEHIADQFAYERTAPEGPTFGFHGLFNFWRHVDDAEMTMLVNGFGENILGTREFMELLATYALEGREEPLRALYAKLRDHVTAAEIGTMIQISTNNPALAESVVRTGEALLRRA